MPVYPISPGPESPALTESPPIPHISPTEHVFGRGVLTPFRRDGKRSIANGVGEELLRSIVGQVLGTVSHSRFSRGELPWRPDFGSTLTLLRHQRLGGRLKELARTGVVEAVRRWIPEIDVTGFDIEAVASSNSGQRDTLQVKIAYRFSPTSGLTPGSVSIQGTEDDEVVVRL